jgi:tRNA threonylcarbamoyladenosine biosynthesis protein TsaE
MTPVEFVAITRSDRETIELGYKLGTCLAQGDVVALVGELGSGKTWLTKGIARGVGVAPDTVITSPTFALVNEYQGKTTLFHMDVYRLSSLAEFLSAGIEDYLYGEGVTVLEWADRWPGDLPEQTIRVELFILDDRSRRISLSGDHVRAAVIIQAVKKSWLV